MNREIKFRGKDIHHGAWIFGDLLQYNDGDVNIGEHDKHWTDDGLHWNTHSHVVCVDEDTVGQYTGLKDKNGVEIYEGDIVSYNDTVATVEWDSFLTGFCIHEGNSWFSIGAQADLCPMVVIGNIHDNPELIRKEEPK